MKYAVNHRHAFLDYKKAFMMGFLQSFLTIGVETVNLLVILQSNTTQDVVMNFIAVAIISDFDNFVFSSLRNSPLKELVDDNAGVKEEFLRVSFTTSPKARSFDKGGQESGVVDENGEPICMKINFWRDRSFLNKFCYLVYKVMRVFFVAFYFYFYPPISILLTFWIPMTFRYEYKASWVEINNMAGEEAAGVPPEYTLAIAGITTDQFFLIRDSMRTANVTSIDRLPKGNVLPKKDKPTLLILSAEQLDDSWSEVALNATTTADYVDAELLASLQSLDDF